VRLVYGSLENFPDLRTQRRLVRTRRFQHFAPAIQQIITDVMRDFLEDLTVPSGQLCQVRRPGVEGLVKAGVLNDMDSLSAIVDNKHIKRAKGMKPTDVNIASLDQATMDSMFHVVDRIVCYVVVQPHIEMTPNDPTRRVSGVIYADMVDLTDKMFLVNYAVGGTRDLERFRGELDESLRSLDAGEDVEDQA
jgi:hypothetical protein